ncbi:DUF4342 domain-containing protein [Clostridium sp. 'White wine YQ']|uniref:DUF4342 domain-containing protein n=1 Tax=Clostridium sp. 'White wine YQ' TaxID=3027474 RepID=UPI00236583F2|nr:DUF4342 domain-containing protein [Clostridium sp. 'White wine YQ']MDD7794520.1 DUF4342 domain-containing protein [Clostridium sp. 'White wine YQ']
MSEVTLEKVDKVIERTGVSYGEAKEALENSEGDVLDAIIYIENLKKQKAQQEENNTGESIEEFKAYLKDLINKGNVTRIKIKKDEKVIVDVPVNAGIAAGVIGIILPQLMAIGVIAAIVTKITVEITKENGEVEVVNKYIKGAYEDIKYKASDAYDIIKNKVNDMKSGVKGTTYKAKSGDSSDEKFYTYTVKFDDEE